MDKLVNERIVAERLGLSVKTVQKWRDAGHGPAWVRVGPRAVRYSERAIARYLEANERQPLRAPRGVR